MNVPVIAAGGIADGRQMAAALALGACGVQVGTCLLVSQECPIHENYKMALLKAKDSDTTVTGRSIGGPVRVLEEQNGPGVPGSGEPGATLEELERCTLGGLRRAVFDGDGVTGSGHDRPGGRYASRDPPPAGDFPGALHPGTGGAGCDPGCMGGAGMKLGFCTLARAASTREWVRICMKRILPSGRSWTGRRRTLI